MISGGNSQAPVTVANTGPGAYCRAPPARRVVSPLATRHRESRKAGADAGFHPAPRPGQSVSPDPSLRQDAAGIADGRSDTAESATPPRPALAVLAQGGEATSGTRGPFQLRRTASASGGGVQALAAPPPPSRLPATVVAVSMTLRPVPLHRSSPYSSRCVDDTATGAASSSRARLSLTARTTHQHHGQEMLAHQFCI